MSTLRTLTLLTALILVPYLVSSSIGSGLTDATIQSLVNVLDFGMNPYAAVPGTPSWPLSRR